jgi:hypothetical protein
LVAQGRTLSETLEIARDIEKARAVMKLYFDLKYNK